MKYLCKKNLTMRDYGRVFTRGKEYETVQNANFAEDDILFSFINDDQALHGITEEWAKHFTKVETKSE